MSVVYFVRIGHDGPIKIGFTTQIDLRFAQLQAACPWRLNLIGSTPGLRQDEVALHRRLGPHRMLGEWFTPHEDVLAAIDHALSIGFSIPEVHAHDSPQAALAEAIKNAGGTLELAGKLRLSHQAIGQWKICPPLRVRAVSQHGNVPDWRLRPDLYPAPEEAAA